MWSPHGEYPKIPEPPASERRYHPRVQRGGACRRRGDRKYLLEPRFRAGDSGVHLVIVAAPRARRAVPADVHRRGPHGGRRNRRRGGNAARDHLRRSVHAGAFRAHSLPADRRRWAVAERDRLPQGGRPARLAAQPSGCGRGPLRLAPRRLPGADAVFALPPDSGQAAPLRHGDPRCRRGGAPASHSRGREADPVARRPDHLARAACHRRFRAAQPLCAALYERRGVQQVVRRRHARRHGCRLALQGFQGVPGGRSVRRLYGRAAP